ncbi:hypothetical protein L1987_76721 [Smallanthus sonchifolius]|uniref:Uncharacterized protein n=1 Tax=Smallanthus sonchifolius TaxID=185202 RepID=A0ACB8Z7Y4_9ASTR|nr:hypothetical protein L1987_76721 [Smallanthus sonchifolius]
MWNPNSMTTVDSQDEDESWEVKAFAEDTGNTWPPRSYTCTFCRREFRSAQALGGHMNVHRRDRARLHQTRLTSKLNPNLSSSSSSSTLLIPSEQLVAADAGLCLLFSVPNPNAIFKPSSNLNNLNRNPSGRLLSHPGSSNLMNVPAVNYSLSSSSNNEASTSIHSQRISLAGNKKAKTDLAVEGVDLELRLGCSSSGYFSRSSLQIEHETESESKSTALYILPITFIGGVLPANLSAWKVILSTVN